MGRNQILFNGGQVGFQADFFVLDAQLFPDVVPVEINRAFRQIHDLCDFLGVFSGRRMGTGIDILIYVRVTAFSNI
jgi:hypothetical protein